MEGSFLQPTTGGRREIIFSKSDYFSSSNIQISKFPNFLFHELQRGNLAVSFIPLRSTAATAAVRASFHPRYPSARLSRWNSLSVTCAVTQSAPSLVVEILDPGQTGSSQRLASQVHLCFTLFPVPVKIKKPLPVLGCGDRRRSPRPAG